MTKGIPQNSKEAEFVSLLLQVPADQREAVLDEIRRISSQHQPASGGLPERAVVQSAPGRLALPAWPDRLALAMLTLAVCGAVAKVI